MLTVPPTMLLMPLSTLSTQRFLLNTLPKKDVLVFCGVFNATLGATLDVELATAGRHIIGQRNNNGERLMQFALTEGLVITNTTFRKKEAQSSNMALE